MERGSQAPSSASDHRSALETQHQQMLVPQKYQKRQKSQPKQQNQQHRHQQHHQQRHHLYEAQQEQQRQWQQLSPEVFLQLQIQQHELQSQQHLLQQRQLQLQFQQQQQDGVQQQLLQQQSQFLHHHGQQEQHLPRMLRGLLDFRFDRIVQVVKREVWRGQVETVSRVDQCVRAAVDRAVQRRLTSQLAGLRSQAEQAEGLSTSILGRLASLETSVAAIARALGCEDQGSEHQPATRKRQVAGGNQRLRSPSPRQHQRTRSQSKSQERTRKEEASGGDRKSKLNDFGDRENTNLKTCYLDCDNGEEAVHRYLAESDEVAAAGIGSQKGTDGQFPTDDVQCSQDSPATGVNGSCDSDETELKYVENNKHPIGVFKLNGTKQIVQQGSGVRTKAKPPQKPPKDESSRLNSNRVKEVTTDHQERTKSNGVSQHVPGTSQISAKPGTGSTEHRNRYGVSHNANSGNGTLTVLAVKTVDQSSVADSPWRRNKASSKNRALPVTSNVPREDQPCSDATGAASSARGLIRQAIQGDRSSEIKSLGEVPSQQMGQVNPKDGGPDSPGEKNVERGEPDTDTGKAKEQESDNSHHQTDEEQIDMEDPESELMASASSEGGLHKLLRDSVDAGSMTTMTMLTGNRARYTFDLKLPEFSGRACSAGSEVSSRVCHVQSLGVQGRVCFLASGLQAWFIICKNYKRNRDGEGDAVNKTGVLVAGTAEMLQKSQVSLAKSEKNGLKGSRSEVCKSKAKVKAALVDPRGKLSEMAIGPEKEVEWDPGTEPRLPWRLGLLHHDDVTRAGYTKAAHGGDTALVRFTIEMADDANDATDR